MELREYKPEDKFKVRKLIDKVSIELLGQKLVKEWENFDDYVLFYVCIDEDVDKDKVVGTAALKDEGEGICKLKRMYVDKDYRGKEIGQRLLYKMLLFAYDEGFKEMRLATIGEGSPSIRFYKKNGFKRIRSPNLKRDFKEMENEDINVSEIVCMKRKIN